MSEGSLIEKLIERVTKLEKRIDEIERTANRAYYRRLAQNDDPPVGSF